MNNNKLFNAFISLAEKPIVHNWAVASDGGRLQGLSCAIKDNICTNFLPTTCASKTLSNWTPTYNATIVDLVMREGVSVVGKTNMDEFGMGSEGRHSFYGPVRNPNNPVLVAGGSSSGSAAAVASGSCDFALGTDTGGSVRIPAAYCQVWGFKPSYGRISRFGVINYAGSLDTVGLLAKDLSVLRRVFEVVDVYDDNDPTSASPDLRQTFACSNSKGAADREVTVGIPLEYFPSEISNDALNEFQECIEQLKAKGIRIVMTSIPHLRYALAAYYIIASAESSSNLSKFDGIKYGFNSASDSTGTNEVSGEVKDEGLVVRNRTEAFGREVQRRIMLGNYVLSGLNFDQYFTQAQKIRRLLQLEFKHTFKTLNSLESEMARTESVTKDVGEAVEVEKCDYLLTPVTFGGPAFIKSDDDSETDSGNCVNEYINDSLATPSSLAGLPSLTVPVNLKKSGQATSVQLIGQFGSDFDLLEFAHHLFCCD